jgi:gluconate 2-dehydrogenase gamma chain
MNESDTARRRFLFATGGALAGTWAACNWPAIAAAAAHAEHAGHAASTDRSISPQFALLSVADAADVEAIASQILPSGASPGAREAHAVYFIDRALATFFSDRAAPFRVGLAEFRQAFGQAYPQVASFSAASAAEQTRFLTSVERTDFFASLRMLTIVGTLCSPSYGGNFEGTGWKLLGFRDQHVFTPPFGYYDRGYPGFTPGRTVDTA